jgi:DNA-binding CsgD family transcriptional regulator
LFVRAVEAIYDAAAAPEKWPEALQAFADCFGDLGAILIWRRDDGGFGTVVSPSLIEAQKDYEENKWYLRDFASQRTVEGAYLQRADVISDSDDIVTEEERNTHPYYTEFSARHGIRWRMAIAVAPDPRIAVWMALQRGPHKSPHSDAEREIAGRLGRHVEKSLRLSIRLFDAEMSKLALSEALMRLGIGVFALDSLGRVVFSNPAAKRLLGDQISVVNGALRMGSGEQRAEIDRTVRKVLKGEVAELPDDSKPILLHRVQSDRPLVIYLLPASMSAGAADQFLTHTRAIVLVIDPKTDDPADPALVRDVLGLTLGEARVAALVGTGLPPREAAAKLGIAEETARSALKRVFSKVGVSRQSELSALLTKLVLR